MGDFPWAGDVWRPSKRTLRATRFGDAYSVRFAINPSSAAVLTWRQLSRTSRPDDGVVHDGGASFRRLHDDVFEVVSGGEDVLDSLSWSLNCTLLEAVRAIDADHSVQIRVLAEGRDPLPDE